MGTLAEVLAGHAVVEMRLREGRNFRTESAAKCECGTESDVLAVSGEAMHEWHRAHITAAIEQHLAEILAADATREVVDGATTRALMAEPIRGELSLFPVQAVASRAADAALAAVAEALGIEATT